MSKIDLTILGIIQQKPMHGYELIHFADKVGLGKWANIKQASAYKSLNRLAKKNYLSYEIMQQDNNPSKKTFFITTKGKQYLNNLLDSFLFTDEVGNMDFWMAVRFSKHNISRKKFEDALKKRLDLVLEKKEKMKAIRNTHCQNAKIPFYAMIMMEGFDNVREIEIQTIQKILDKCKDSEVNSVFINEKI